MSGTGSADRQRLALPLALSIGLGLLVGSQAPAEKVRAQATGAYVIADTWASVAAPRPADSWPAASGLAIDAARRIYVADAAEARISVIEPAGAVRLLGDGADLGLVEPRDLAVDAARSRLYVADPGLGGVAVLGLDGARIAVWPGVEAITGLGVAPDGRVLAGAALAGEVRRFEPDGTPLAPIRAVTQGAGARITGLDVAADGSLVVLDATRPQLLRFDPRGARLDPIALPSTFVDVVADYSLGIFTRQWYWFTDAAGLHAYDPLRDQWQLADGLDGLDRLAVYPPLGIVVARPGASGSRVHRFDYRLIDLDRARPAASWGSAVEIPGRLESPDRIQVGADGRVYLLDRWPRVQRFGPNGAVQGQLLPGFQPAAVEVAADGRLFVADGGRLLEAYAADGTLRWQQSLENLRPSTAGLALDPAGESLALLDAAQDRILRFAAADGRPLGGEALPAPERGSDVWADLAAGADGTLHALDLGGPSVLTLPPGGPPDRVGVGLSARRLALRADGLRLILGRDGWVRGRDAQGRLQTAFDASRPDLDPGSRPADLAVDAAGDVLVVDRVAASVTRWTWDPAAEPPRAPEAEPSCRAEGDKRAAPAEIALGETVELTLSLDGRCEGAQASVPLDVFLLLDRSGSMGGESLRVAREAALDFIARADLASTRIGLISFNTQARVDAPLGQDAWRLRQALTSLDARGGTDIAAALAVANDAIGQSGRLSARWAFILLSDGGSAHAPAIAEADRARRAGVEIFTIGVQADAVLLRALADDAEHYFEAARVGDLYAVFARIAERIEAEALFQTLEVVDELPADMALVAGSIDPPPEAIEPGPPVTLRWRLAGVPAEGVVLRYRLQPQQAGLRPTNRIAWADYVDGFGRIGRVDLPLPEVRVIGPTATPSPSPRPSPRASATAPARPTLPAGPSAEPRALYLPLLLQERCIPGARHADVLLVMDASGSMAGAKLVAARAAALQLIDLLSLPADQVGLVAFNAQAMRLAPLGSPRSAVAQALAGLDTSPGTRIDRGLSAALAELLGPRARATNTPTLVLLTDGQQAEAPETARARAAEARAFGVQLFAIGLGAELDLDSLAGLAGGRQRAFLAPGPEDLAAIYRAVAGRIPCPAEAFWGRR